MLLHQRDPGASVYLNKCFSIISRKATTLLDILQAGFLIFRCGNVTSSLESFIAYTIDLSDTVHC